MIVKNLCSEIHYEETEKGLILTAVHGIEDDLLLPDEIDGIPITEIAAYAFADSKITGIRLPFGVREIGRYAFYRCRHLRKMILSDEILEIGGGALTGCRGIREVEIHFRKGEKSALKSILDEVRFAVHAKLYMGDAKAEILIPEHYEEAVEDTPARQLYTQHHGAGGDYRQCFYNRELDYKKYDSLLPRAIAEDTVETIVKMSLGRLQFPYRLSKEAKNSYEKYIREHQKDAVEILVEQEETEALRFLCEEKYFTEETFTYGIECAARENKTELLGYLMDEKRKAFPKKKKTFDL